MSLNRTYIRNILDSKTASAVVLAIAIASRLIQVVFFYNIRMDASFQVIAMQSFVAGHGFSTITALPGDIATAVYTPLIDWPPGYSTLLAPFYLLSGGNYIVAGITLDVLFAIFMILTTRKILFLLEVPTYLVNLSTLLVGFFIYYFYFIASSDSITISLYIFGVYLALRTIRSQSYHAGRTILLALVLGYCAAIKYLFIPVVVTIPLLLFVKGYLDGVPAWRRQGLHTGLILAILITAVLVYQKTTGGSATYISAPGRGFYPEHLGSFYPFLPASLIKPDTPGAFLSLSASANRLIYRVFQVVHLLGLTTLILLTLRFWKKRGLRHLSLKGTFFALVLLAALAITLLLAALSLFVAREEILPGYFWTYIEEARYYGLICVLIHLGLFLAYYQFMLQGSRKGVWLFGIFIALAFAEAARGLVFDSRRVQQAGKETYSWQWDQRFQQAAGSVINKERAARHTSHAVVAGPSQYLNHRVVIWSQVPRLVQIDTIPDPAIVQATANTVVLLVIPEQNLPAWQSLLQNIPVNASGTFDHINFYTWYVKGTPK